MSATALVIDDEVMVRQLVRRMLEPDTCRVLEAVDGEHGLRMIEEGGDAIHVVLTDLLMPGIDGYDVVEVLVAHRPELPVVCMSGFASHNALGRRIQVPFIAKPFDHETLQTTLHPLLERSRERRRAALERASSEALRHRAFAAQTESTDLVAAAHELRRRRAGNQATG